MKKGLARSKSFEQGNRMMPRLVGLISGLESRVEELFDPIERNHLQIVVQIDVVGARDDQQLFVVAGQPFESVFAEIPRVGFRPMDHQNGTANFVDVG